MSKESCPAATDWQQIVDKVIVWRSSSAEGVCAGVLQDAYSGETMAQYVFRRLSSEGRQAELLTLPDTFSADLHSWLLQQVQLQLPGRSIGVSLPCSPRYIIKS